MTDQTLRTKLPTPFTFSQSSLQDYLDCNRRFQLRYIEKLQWPAVETAPILENERRQAEGQHFHRMVHQYLLGLPLEKIEKMAGASSDQNLSRWWNHFLAETKNSLSSLANSAVFPEQSLSAPLGGQRLVAKYDLIAVQNGKATIYDWKTYHKRPRNEVMAVRTQTRVYLSLLAAAGAHFNNGAAFGPGNIEMIYWYADFPSEPARFTYNASQYQREWQGLEGLAREISAKQSYPMTDDEKKCGFCPYRSFCERGSTAQAGEEMEDGEATNWDLRLEQIQEIEF